MKYLLDTNVVSELLKLAPDVGVADWLKWNHTQCALSALTVAEMASGIERMATGKRRNHFASALKFLQEDFQAGYSRLMKLWLGNLILCGVPYSAVRKKMHEQEWTGEKWTEETQPELNKIYFQQIQGGQQILGQS